MFNNDEDDEVLDDYASPVDVHVELVRVATRKRQAFQPSDPTLPAITSEGAELTRQQADQVLAEANSGTTRLVFEVNEQKEGE
jgi:hypothetical protein